MSNCLSPPTFCLTGELSETQMTKIRKSYTYISVIFWKNSVFDTDQLSLEDLREGSTLSTRSRQDLYLANTHPGQSLHPDHRSCPGFGSRPCIAADLCQIRFRFLCSQCQSKKVPEAQTQFSVMWSQRNVSQKTTSDPVKTFHKLWSFLWFVTDNLQCNTEVHVIVDEPFQ